MKEDNKHLNHVGRENEFTIASLNKQLERLVNEQEISTKEKENLHLKMSKIVEERDNLKNIKNENLNAISLLQQRLMKKQKKFQI